MPGHSPVCGCGHAFVLETEGRVELHEPILAGENHSATALLACGFNRMAQYASRIAVTSVIRVSVHAEDHLPRALRIVHAGIVVHLVEQMRLVSDHAVDEAHEPCATVRAMLGFQQPEMVGERAGC